jgi:hypothetical protein
MNNLRQALPESWKKSWASLPANSEKLCEFFVSPGFCEEKMWLYLATDLHETAQRLEEDEMIEVVRVPVDRALEMITEAKSKMRRLLLD